MEINGFAFWRLTEWERTFYSELGSSKYLMNQRIKAYPFTNKVIGFGDTTVTIICSKLHVPWKSKSAVP